MIYWEHSDKKSGLNGMASLDSVDTLVIMESAIYGIVVVLALMLLSLAGYIWYLTPGKHDRLE